MTAQVEAKRSIERVTGVSNVAFDLVTILENKLQGIAAIEQYKMDCRESGDMAAEQLLDRLQQRAIEDVEVLRGYMKDRL